MKGIFFFVVLFILPAAVFAVTPQFWEESSQESYSAGDPQSISITSDGELLLAPQLRKIYDGTQSIIWKIARDSKGNIFAATGNDGKVIKIDTAGKSSTFLATKELEAQALLVDKNDNLFVGTSPNGKIYRVKPDGTSNVFFDPQDRYIWSLTQDDEGNVYAGTGDQGRIYKIDKNGNGKVLIDTNETNITVVVWDKAKKLLAGSDKSGILYSVDETGKAFVLFDTDLQQITSIYSDPAGEIYFSAISGIVPAAPQKSTTEPVQPTVPVPQSKPTQQESDKRQSTQSGNSPGESNPAEGEGEAEVTTSVEMTTVTPQPATTKVSGASQVYRITNNGLIEVVYTATEDQILDITGYKDNRLLLSTGKKAKLILLDKNKKSTIMLKAPEEQITSLIPGDHIFLATANPGNIYELAEDHANKGTFYSDVKDTQTLSQWGQVSWKATIPAETSLRLLVRSGNTRIPDATWSAWADAGMDPAGKSMQLPKARFVQWRADFLATDTKVSPILREVKLAYLQQNIRPEVLAITLYPAGAVFRKAYSQENFAGVPDEDDSAAKEQQDQNQAIQAQTDVTQTLGKKEYKRGYQTITWNATDENQDELRYDVYYRASGEKNWKVLGKNLREKVFAWDTETMPDGTYNIKVVVNDSGSNPKEYVLSNEKESDTFDVDNSAPQIQVLSAKREKSSIVITVQAKDQYSAIKDMQYSIQPGIWNEVFPVDAINDSPQETYRIELKDMSADNADIVFKCSDRGNNVATIKYKIP